MAIPAMFISYISFERSSRADDVTRSVSNIYGGRQTLTGPIISVPYVGIDKDGKVNRQGDYIIYADTGEVVFNDIKTETRKRSLFRVPIFTAEGEMKATFLDPKAITPDGGMELQWESAQILMAVSDVRGLKRDINLKVKGQQVVRQFEPAMSRNLPQTFSDYEYAKDFQSFSISHTHAENTYLSVPAADLIVAGESFSVEVSINIGGAETFGVRPFARSTQVALSSIWPDPGFVGDLPPDSREITENGFSAKWSVPYLRRGIRGHGEASILSKLMQSQNLMGVKFVATDNPYQTVNRALKYAVLFIGLVFLAYFLMEVIVGIPVHPAQYILIGLAQAIFYLMLLAFSEHIGFALAFILSATATIVATAGYAGAVFKKRDYVLKTGLVFTIVYGLLFVLMRLQDFALMIGALTSFVAIAGTMYLTRDLNWYGDKSS
jgi:inner membrane protein